MSKSLSVELRNIVTRWVCQQRLVITRTYLEGVERKESTLRTSVVRRCCLDVKSRARFRVKSSEVSSL